MANKKAFSQALDAYSALASANQTSHASSRRSRYMRAGMSFGAATSAALLTGTAIEAGIVYSGVQNIDAGGTNSAANIDIDGGGVDFQFFDRQASGGNWAWGRAYRQTSPQHRFMRDATGNIPRQAVKLSSGDLVGTAGSGLGSGTYNPFFAGTGPAFQGGFTSDTGLVGFQLGGSGNFGWIRVAVAGTNQLTVVDWAYDNTGAHLFAGQESSTAVPEPSSAFLLGLGLLSLGAVGLREKRRNAREAAAKLIDPATTA